MEVEAASGPADEHLAVDSDLQYNFEWDPAKASINLRKHKVSFERGATVFGDPGALTVHDREHSDEEERWVTMGIDSTGLALVVCHTFHEEGGDTARIRIISARKATRREERQYAKAQ